MWRKNYHNVRGFLAVKKSSGCSILSLLSDEMKKVRTRERQGRTDSQTDFLKTGKNPNEFSVGNLFHGLIYVETFLEAPGSLHTAKTFRSFCHDSVRRGRVWIFLRGADDYFYSRFFFLIPWNSQQFRHMREQNLVAVGDIFARE